MYCTKKMELAIAMGIMTALCNIVSADTGPKSHSTTAGGSHTSGRNGNPISHTFTFSNFGKSNPAINERSAKVGHNQHGDKLSTRDTAAASSFSQTSPQQPDPSIALLPRGDQEGTLFGKEGSSGNPFSGSSTSETTGFGGSQLGFQQGVQLPGFPSTFGGFAFSPSASPAASSQGVSTGRNPQGAAIARYPQGFPLGGFAPYAGALGGFPQGLAVAGFPQGATFGGFPQGATFGAFAPGATLTAFPYGAALSPVPGAFAAPAVPLKGQQQAAPGRGSPYPFASPAGYQIYNQVPAQAYQSPSQK